MTDSELSAQKAQPIRFIRDVAADSDFFGPHSQVANAIAEVLETNEDLKVIGLLGPWGSGKSTVIRQVQTKLEASEVTPDPHVFCYDAWLFQSDPPRRSFLETFINFLVFRKLTTKEVWRKKLDQLNRRVEETDTTTTPTLTLSGKMLILSALLVPLGLQFIGHDWFEEAFGKDRSLQGLAIYGFGAFLLILPIVVLIFAYLSRRPKAKVTSKFFWLGDKDPETATSLFAVFTNKAVETTRNKVTRDPEPTAIEFQEIFREILKAVSHHPGRMVIVIDNLDRLHGKEAVAMWSTIRSFFLGSNQDPTIRQNLPVILLPIDETALVQMYASSEADSASLSQSFLDKTFDLTFRLNRPVSTDWKDYLSRQMKYTFGDIATEENIFHAGRILEFYSGGIQSPRSINVTINSIGALWLQRRDDISFVSIAYYVIAHQYRENDILSIIRGSAFDISDADADWQRSIAAVHFGVTLDKAIQISLEQPISAAVAANDGPAFLELSRAKGFEQVFQNFLHTAQPGPNGRSGEVIANLLSELNVSNAPWLKTAWWTLRRFMIAEIPHWDRIDESRLSGLKIILAQKEAADFGKFVRAYATALEANTHREKVADPKQAPILVNMLRELVTHAIEAGTEIQAFKINAEAAQYVTVVTMAANVPKLIAILKPIVASEAITQIIIDGISSGASSEILLPQFDALRQTSVKLNWNTHVQFVGDFIRQNSASGPSFRFACVFLGRLDPTLKSATNMISALNKEGVFNAKIQELGITDEPALVTLTTLVILTYAPGPVAINWRALDEQYPGFWQALDTELLSYNEHCTVDYYIDMVAANADFLPIASKIVNSRIENDRVGTITTKYIFSSIDTYFSVIGADHLEKFFFTVAEFDGFWTDLEAGGFTAGNLKVLSLLAGAVAPWAGTAHALTAQAHLKVYLNGLTSADWNSALRTSSQILIDAELLYRLTHRSPDMVGNQLVHALEELASDVLFGPDLWLATNWFRATNFVSIAARRTLLKNLRDTIIGSANIANLREILEIGGEDFLIEGDFTGISDSAARRIVVFQLDETVGRTWLQKNANLVKAWIKNSDEDTRQFLADRFDELRGSVSDEQKAEFDGIADIVTPK